MKCMRDALRTRPVDHAGYALWAQFIVVDMGRRLEAVQRLAPVFRLRGHLRAVVGDRGKEESTDARR